MEWMKIDMEEKLELLDKENEMRVGENWLLFARGKN